MHDCRNSSTCAVRTPTIGDAEVGGAGQRAPEDDSSETRTLRSPDSLLQIASWASPSETAYLRRRASKSYPFITEQNEQRSSLLGQASARCLRDAPCRNPRCVRHDIDHLDQEGTFEPGVSQECLTPPIELFLFFRLSTPPRVIGSHVPTFHPRAHEAQPRGEHDEGQERISSEETEYIAMHQGVAQKDTALSLPVPQTCSRPMNNELRSRGFNSWQAHEGWRTRVRKVLVEGARANQHDVLHDLVIACRCMPC